MKILKQGKTIDSAWWIGHFFRCPDCGCEFELERGDDVDVARQRVTGLGVIAMIASVACPSCGGALSVSHRVGLNP